MTAAALALASAGGRCTAAAGLGLAARSPAARAPMPLRRTVAQASGSQLPGRPLAPQKAPASSSAASGGTAAPGGAPAPAAAAAAEAMLEVRAVQLLISAAICPPAPILLRRLAPSAPLRLLPAHAIEQTWAGLLSRRCRTPTRDGPAPPAGAHPHLSRSHSPVPRRRPPHATSPSSPASAVTSCQTRRSTRPPPWAAALWHASCAPPWRPPRPTPRAAPSACRASQVRARHACLLSSVPSNMRMAHDGACREGCSCRRTLSCCSVRRTLRTLRSRRLPPRACRPAQTPYRGPGALRRGGARPGTAPLQAGLGSERRPSGGTVWQRWWMLLLRQPLAARAPLLGHGAATPPTLPCCTAAPLPLLRRCRCSQIC